MAKKKITRKQLLKEPDEFLTFSGKLFRFATAHKKKLAIAVGGLVAVGVLFAGVGYFTNKAENKAVALLDSATAAYATQLKSKDPQAAYREVAKDFQHLVDQYGQREGGKMARIVFADICYQAGETDRAVALYTTALSDFKDRPSLKNLILSGLAYSLEQKKDYQGAAAHFESIVAGTDPTLKDDALYNLGIIYTKTGNPEKSAEMFNKILEDYPDHPYRDLIRERTAG